MRPFRHSKPEPVENGPHEEGGAPGAAPTRPDLLALLMCASAAPGSPSAAEIEARLLPSPPERRDPEGRGREGGGFRVPLPAAVQPRAEILSALTTDQKVSPFIAHARMTVSGAFLIVRSDGLPNHETDIFPTDYNPNRILPQNYLFRIPLRPRFAEKPVPLPFGPIGVAINGIPFYNPYHREGRDVVLGPNAEIFDSPSGHPDRFGRYHYPKYPVGPRSPFPAERGGHSPLIGWAFDGFAIYGPHGAAGEPPLDLDECHGHIDGERGYHYHVTARFPYLLGAYRGVPEMSNFPGPQVWGIGRP